METTRHFSRRAFCLTGLSAAVGAGVACGRAGATAVAAASTAAESDVTLQEFTDAGVASGTVTVPKIVKSEDAWRKHLSSDSFDVTRHEGTEAPFSGKYWNTHESGLFRCICCDTALFSSDTKFDSGTGWPSFWAPIAKENVVETTDRSLFMVRTAVSCRRCDAHLGHVFDDGPKPTSLRYCMNSVALRLVRAI
jgi:peptide-methionine (R)-S-oxide reductase